VEQLLTVEEAAERLACKPSTVRKWLFQRRLPKVKIGRLTRLRAVDIADVIARGLPQPGPGAYAPARA
jgi:excisionase family DNA binding protein